MNDPKYVRLVGGYFDAMKVSDPGITMHEDHLIEILRPNGDRHPYLIDDEGAAVKVHIRSHAARNAAVTHTVNQEDLQP